MNSLVYLQIGYVWYAGFECLGGLDQLQFVSVLEHGVDGGVVLNPPRVSLLDFDVKHHLPGIVLGQQEFTGQFVELNVHVAGDVHHPTEGLRKERLNVRRLVPREHCNNESFKN